AGKGVRHNSRPLLPSIRTAAGPSNATMSSNPDRPGTTSAGAWPAARGSPRTLQSSTPLAASTARVTPSLLVPTTSRRSGENRCASKGRGRSPTAARQPPLVTIGLALAVGAVDERVGFAAGLISILPAEENWPRVSVNGATRQK